MRSIPISSTCRAQRFTKMQICDWEGLDEDLALLAAKIGRGEPASPPFPMLIMSDSAELQ